MDYANEVMTVVKETLNRYSAIDEKIRALEARFRANDIGNNAYAGILAELKSQKDEAHLSAAGGIMRLEKEYAAAVEKLYATVDASQLDPDAQLLELENFKPTPEQFSAMAEKHRGNRLMTQLLLEYQNKHPGLGGVYIQSAEEIIRQFNQYTASANFTINNPDSLQAAFFLEGKYTPQNTDI